MRKLTQRRSQRQQMVLDGVCFTSANRKFEVELLDLTTEGCRLSLGRQMLSIFEPVAIKPQGLEALAGTVCWVLNGEAGVKFERTIYEPVFDHLCRLHALELTPATPEAADLSGAPWRHRALPMI